MNQRGSSKKIILQPFSAEDTMENSQISALISNDGYSLEIVFELTARLAVLKIPEFDPSKSERKDNLWEHTCFEIFLAQKGKPDYLEFNISPSGDWNVYCFSGYRKGMKQEDSFKTLPVEVKILSDQKLKLKISIDAGVFKNFSGIDVGLSAVIERRNGGKSYWAVSHPGVIPDFHGREGWVNSL